MAAAALISLSARPQVTYRYARYGVPSIFQGVRFYTVSAVLGDSLESSDSLCSCEPSHLSALREETAERWPGGAHMISGAQQGRLLHTLVRLSRAARVLEVGCFTGYATMWMARALPPGGRLLSLERDDRAAEVARRHLAAGGVADRVEVRLGDALTSLAELPAGEPPFDIIFLDADKKRCGAYFHLLMERGLLAQHSLLLVDNVLWKGEVLELMDPDAITSTSPTVAELVPSARRSMQLRDALHSFSMELAADRRVQQLVLPLRDGLTWAQPPMSWDVPDVRLEASLRSVACAATTDELVAVTTASPALDRLPAYLRRVSSGEPTICRALRCETAERWPDRAHMVSSLQLGRLLHMLVRLSRAARVLEVGSFTGYATLWMALALPPGGHLRSVERDEYAVEVAHRHLNSGGVSSCVELRCDGALASLAELIEEESHFDVIVWHGLRSPSSEPDASLLDELNFSSLLEILAPHGTLIITTLANKRDSWHSKLLEDSSLSVVTIPSPDGDNTLISLISTGGF